MNGANVDYGAMPSATFSGEGAHMLAGYDPSSGGPALGTLLVTVVVRRLDSGARFVGHYSVPYDRGASDVEIGEPTELSPTYLTGIIDGVSVTFDTAGANVRAWATLGALATGDFEGAVYFDGKGFML